MSGQELGRAHPALSLGLHFQQYKGARRTDNLEPLATHAEHLPWRAFSGAQFGAVDFERLSLKRRKRSRPRVERTNPKFQLVVAAGEIQAAIFFLQLRGVADALSRLWSGDIISPQVPGQNLANQLP